MVGVAPAHSDVTFQSRLQRVAKGDFTDPLRSCLAEVLRSCGKFLDPAGTCVDRERFDRHLLTGIKPAPEPSDTSRIHNGTARSRPVKHAAEGIDITVITQNTDIDVYYHQAMTGDVMARTVWAGAKQVLHGMDSGAADDPVTCALCAMPTKKTQFSAAILCPSDHTYSNALALVFCQHCAPDQSDIAKKAQIALRALEINLRITRQPKRDPHSELLRRVEKLERERMQQ
jgi:hypothetical protein